MIDLKKMLTKITQSVGVHFGESSSVTLPFTAQKDGLITIRVSPTDNTNAYYIVGENGSEIYRSNMFNGYGTVGQVFAKKGKTYSVVAQNKVKIVTVTFSPLEVGGGVLLKWLKGSILNAFSHRRKAVAAC